MSLSSSAVTLRSVSVLFNRAYGHAGAAILRGGSTLSAFGSFLDGNLAGEKGGGLYLLESVLAASNTTIDDNEAGTIGGGVCAHSGSTVTLTEGTSVRGNTAADGGGLYVIESVLAASGAAIDDNEAGYEHGGGVMAVFYSTVTLAEGTFVRGNRAAVDGGGLFVELSELTVSGAAIEGNTADLDGGGVQAQTSSTVTLTEGTSVYGNTAGYDGGGIRLLSASSLRTSSGTVIAGNAALAGQGRRPLRGCVLHSRARLRHTAPTQQQRRNWRRSVRPDRRQRPGRTEGPRALPAPRGAR